MTIRDILLDYNIQHANEGSIDGRPGWLQVSCPDCGDRSSKGYAKLYLGISLSTGASNCWRCGKKSTASVIARLANRPITEIREKLDGAVMATPATRKTGRLALPRGRGAMLPGHRHYLATRGIDADRVALAWGVEGIGHASGEWHYLRWRLFIPIHHHGEIVSWTTRSIQPNTRQRYLSAGVEQEAVHHKSILYGADYAKHAIIIHEGPLDVWATGPGAVATCGTAYTEAQLLAMSRYPIRVVCFDSHPEAQTRARGLADALSAFPGTTKNVQLETGEDAADADSSEIANLRTTFLE